VNIDDDIEESLKEITRKENMRLRDLAMGGVSEIAPEVKMSENLFQEFVTRITTLRDRVDEKEKDAKEAAKSVLPPLSGTLAERQAAYDEISPVMRFWKEQTDPTPAGQEPNSIQLAKKCAWAGVLSLALIELVVSVKVGGMPFEIQKISWGFKEGVTVVQKPKVVIPTYAPEVPFDSTKTGPRSIGMEDNK